MMSVFKSELFRSKQSNRFLIAGFVFLLPSLAMAHHPLGGMTPTSFYQGLLSGIGHPIIGLDHLAFVIAAGILAWKIGKPLLLLGSFVAATTVGSLMVSSGASFSFKEPFILLSVAVVGLTLIRKKNPGDKLTMLFYPLAGFFHGSAYGEAVVGAETSPIIAYLFGFAIIQFLIAYAAAQTVKLFSQSLDQSMRYAQITGAVVLGVAVTYGFEIVEGLLFVSA